jgi:hypothetical protein
MKLKIPQFTLNREKLEKVKKRIIVWIGLVAIILGTIVLYEKFELEQIKKDKEEWEKKYSQAIKVMDIHKQLEDSQAEIIRLQKEKEKYEKEKIEMLKDLQLKHYYDKLAEKILGLYSAWGMKRSKEEAKIIYETVPRVFNCVNIMFEKKRIKAFSKSPRITSLRILGAYKKETNFVLDSINQNYVRERPGKFILLFTKEDKKRIEALGMLWDDCYKKQPDGRIEFLFGEKKEYAKPIGRIEKVIIGDKDEVTITIEGVKQKVKAVDYAIKTTRDWGGLQVNDVNLKSGYSELFKLGLWNIQMDRWTLDPEINIWLRLLEFEDRARLNWIDWNSPPWDLSLYAALEKVDGWQGILE